MSTFILLIAFGGLVAYAYYKAGSFPALVERLKVVGSAVAGLFR